MEKYTKHVPWIVENFPFISGITVVTWWALIRFKRSLFSGYVTVHQMDERMQEDKQCIIEKIDYLTLQQRINAQKQSDESIAIRDLMIDHAKSHHE